MYGYTLQDWITIRGASSVLSIAQSEPDWLGLAAFQDIVLWADVREVTLGTGMTNVVLNYETAPAKDESLFTSMVSAPTFTAGSSTPTVTKVLLAQNPTCPLGRWVRWRLSVTGTPTSSWDITFRILCCANAVGLAG